VRGAHPLLVHVLAASLLVGRTSHAYGVSQLKENYRYRVFGMAMTLTALIIASLYLLYSYVLR
jgi:uncharacterized membrane protein YecN with MAPEG domain